MLEFLSVNILLIFYQMAGAEVLRNVVYFESLAHLAIGSVQSLAVVINVMCIYKDVVGMN